MTSFLPLLVRLHNVLILPAGALATWQANNPWSAPEDALVSALSADGHAKGAGTGPEAVVSIDAVDATFPDPNCDRVEGGRWRELRRKMEGLALVGFGLKSPSSLMHWGEAISALEHAYGFSTWLQPTIGPAWVTTGVGVEHAAADASVPFPCPLGVAAVLLATLVVQLGQVHKHFVAGSLDIAFVKLSGDLKPHARAFQAVMRRALARVRFVIPLLAAIRWPILDLLAAAEKHVLRTIQRHVLVSFGGVEPRDCLASRSSKWRALVYFVRDMLKRDGGRNGTFASRSTAGTEELAGYCEWLSKESENQEVFECAPLGLLYAVVCVMSCSSRSHVDAHSGDPEHCFRVHDGMARKLFWDFVFDDVLFIMNFAMLPAFGLWRGYRQLVMHRVELPFQSSAEIADVFGISIRSEHKDFAVDLKLDEHLRYQSAAAAFDFASHDLRGHGRGIDSVAILTACWGPVHSARLHLWLGALERSQILHLAVVMCHDSAALDACRAAHQRPDLCADVRNWPRSMLSKLSGIALLLRRQISVLWLDSDAVVLRNPIPLLVPLLKSSQQNGEQVRRADMLFSVEGDSWNCINGGVFFLRSTAAVRRYLAFWISLSLDRPHAIDQAIVFLLLGLVPSMRWAKFANEEGLLQASSTATGNIRRAEALGALRTPPWGALDGRATFAMSGKIATGGIQYGRLADVAVFQLLDSWPKEAVADPLYADLRDEVYAVLEGLASDGQAGEARAMELVARSVTRALDIADGERRDCRTWFVQGR